MPSNTFPRIIVFPGEFVALSTFSPRIRKKRQWCDTRGRGCCQRDPTNSCKSQAVPDQLVLSPGCGVVNLCSNVTATFLSTFDQLQHCLGLLENRDVA